MSAALHERKGSADEARRLLRRQIRRALKKLSGPKPTDTDIHDARRSIKRARATLRLLRAALTSGDFRRENRLLRDAARPLSAVRDAKILVEAFDDLLQRVPTARAIAGARQLRRSLVRARLDARGELVRSANGLQLSIKLLRRARRAAADWSLRHQGARRLIASAVRLYGEGREALQSVRIEPSVANLHEWRKQAKYLYLQLELLQPLLADGLGHLTAELHTLSDELGSDHDLAMLRGRVAGHAGDFPHESGASEFATLIEHTRTALQRRALRLGGRLYRPEPARFARRLELP